MVNDPKKHFTAHIQVTEVTPAHMTGGGITGTRVEREKDEVLSLTLRDESLDDLLDRVVSLMATFKEGQP